MVDSYVPVVDWSSRKVVIGTPFGSDVAVLQFLTETRAKQHALLCLLTEHADPQLALTLPRFCLDVQRNRTSAPSSLGYYRHHFRGRNRARPRLHLGQLPPGRCLEAVLLPALCIGGFGVQNPTLIHSVAHFASAFTQYSGSVVWSVPWCAGVDVGC